MTGPARPEYLKRRLALRQRGDEVCLGGRLVGSELPGPDRRTSTDPRIDDDALDAAQLVVKRPQHSEDLLVIRYVERTDCDLDAREPCRDLRLERQQQLDAPRAERQIAAARRELERHAAAKSSARTGNQDIG